jgi:hypothetical protein
MRQGDSWDLDAAREYDTPGTGMLAADSRSHVSVYRLPTAS